MKKWGFAADPELTCVTLLLDLHSPQEETNLSSGTGLGLQDRPEPGTNDKTTASDPGS